MNDLKAGRKPRWPFIDYLRATAVILMIIFHFSFDLKAFRYVQIDFTGDLLWWVFPRVIVFLFLFSMGISFEYAYERAFNWRKFNIRLLKVGLGALGISLFTYFAYRNRWIYFGTLHCIFVCSLLIIPLRNKPKLCLILALALLVPLLFGVRWPWVKMAHPSLDYIPALPWLGVVLLGMSAKHGGIHKIKMPENSFIEFLSQHSLFIYLIHQPILFGAVKLFYTLTH